MSIKVVDEVKKLTVDSPKKLTDFELNLSQQQLNSIAS
jgi:hypothetical protein